MAERGIPYKLTTPYGSVIFNDLSAFMAGQPCFLLTNVSGVDGGAVRATVERIPQRDGAVIFDAFQGEMQPILEGKIWAKTAAEIRERADYLKACCKSILRSDGTLSWFPSGAPDRQVLVRLFDKPTIQSQSGTWSRTFQLSLVSPDDRAFSLTQYSQDSTLLASAVGGTFVLPTILPFSFGDATAGGDASCLNSGNTDSYPVIRIYGSVAAPRITNITTGLYVSMLGLSVGLGDYVEIDMRNETVRLNGNEDVSLIAFLDVANSTFFPLIPGTNSIRLTGSNPDGTNAKATVIWRDAWS